MTPTGQAGLPAPASPSHLGSWWEEGFGEKTGFAVVRRTYPIAASLLWLRPVLGEC